MNSKLCCFAMFCLALMAYCGRVNADDLNYYPTDFYTIADGYPTQTPNGGLGLSFASNSTNINTTSTEFGSPQQVVATGSTQATLGSLHAQGTAVNFVASGGAGWGDEFIPTDPMLPIGSPVTYQITQDVDDSVLASGPNAIASVSADTIILDVNLIMGTSTVVAGISYTHSTQPTAGEDLGNTGDPDQQLDFTGYVGYDLWIEADLYGTAKAGPGGIANYDASDTAVTYLDPVTPGASYTTLSGDTYFTPEPPSMAMIVPAVALLLLRPPRPNIS